MSARRFEIRYDGWCGWFLGLLGMGRSRSHVSLEGESVIVRMGWSFGTAIPRSAITSVDRPDWRNKKWIGWGVHGWRGRWLVNGSLHDLVSVEIDPPAPARVIGVPVQLRRVVVSLEEPEAFVDTITSV